MGAGVAGIVLVAGLSYAVVSFNKRSNNPSKCNPLLLLVTFTFKSLLKLAPVPC